MPKWLSSEAEKVWTEAHAAALKEHGNEEAAAKVAMAAIEKAGLSAHKQDSDITVRRWDSGTFRAQRMDNGWLKASATLTRAGVFSYRNEDGSIRRELRHPDEVFNADSLASLELVPLTLRHPKERLTAENTNKYAVGNVGTARRDADNVASTLLVTHADAVRAAESGNARELSCGYKCVLDYTPGEYNGQRYDAIQRTIRYNHVALEPLGRAGRDVCIHLDAADAVMTEDAEPPQLRLDFGDPPMANTTVRIDNVDFEITQQAAQAFANVQQRADAMLKATKDELATSKSEMDKRQAKLDAMAEDLKKVTKERDDARDPAKLTEAIKARVELERKSSAILGADVKLDALSDAEIKAGVIAKVSPETKLDGKSVDYIQARFDAAVESNGQRNDALGAVHQTATNAQTSQRMDAAEARKQMMIRDDKRWQQPATSGKAQ